MSSVPSAATVTSTRPLESVRSVAVAGSYEVGAGAVSSRGSTRKAVSPEAGTCTGTSAVARASSTVSTRHSPGYSAAAAATSWRRISRSKGPLVGTSARWKTSWPGVSS
ncbi:hypothetical protein ACRJ4W_12950 [Streptomyces sp. GLT-R25]